MKVYKLIGECYEITEEPKVYSTKEKAYAAIKEWESFLGISSEDAIKYEEVRIEEWTLE